MDIENIRIRGLTRGEIRTLRKEGITLGKLTEMDENARDAALDRLFGIACPDVDPDAITPGEALDIYTRISELTYLTGNERKNSGSPQSSASTDASMTAASAGKNDWPNPGNADGTTL